MAVEQTGQEFRPPPLPGPEVPLAQRAEALRRRVSFEQIRSRALGDTARAQRLESLQAAIVPRAQELIVPEEELERIEQIADIEAVPVPERVTERVRREIAAVPTAVPTRVPEPTEVIQRPTERETQVTRVVELLRAESPALTEEAARRLVERGPEAVARFLRRQEDISPGEEPTGPLAERLRALEEAGEIIGAPETERVELESALRTAKDFSVGLLPVVGTGQAAEDLIRNWNELSPLDKTLSTSLTAVSAVGDLTIVGGASKLGLKVLRGKTGQKVAEVSVGSTNADEIVGIAREIKFREGSTPKFSIEAELPGDSRQLRQVRDLVNSLKRDAALAEDIKDPPLKRLWDNPEFTTRIDPAGFGELPGTVQTRTVEIKALPNDLSSQAVGELRSALGDVRSDLRVTFKQPQDASELQRVADNLRRANVERVVVESVIPPTIARQQRPVVELVNRLQNVIEEGTEFQQRQVFGGTRALPSPTDLIETRMQNELAQFVRRRPFLSRDLDELREAFRTGQVTRRVSGPLGGRARFPGMRGLIPSGTLAPPRGFERGQVTATVKLTKEARVRDPETGIISTMEVPDTRAILEDFLKRRPDLTFGTVKTDPAGISRSADALSRELRQRGIRVERIRKETVGIPPTDETPPTRITEVELQSTGVGRTFTGDPISTRVGELERGDSIVEIAGQRVGTLEGTPSTQRLALPSGPEPVTLDDIFKRPPRQEPPDIPDVPDEPLRPIEDEPLRTFPDDGEGGLGTQRQLEREAQPRRRVRVQERERPQVSEELRELLRGVAPAEAPVRAPVEAAPEVRVEVPPAEAPAEAPPQVEAPAEAPPADAPARREAPTREAPARREAPSRRRVRTEEVTPTREVTPAIGVPLITEITVPAEAPTREIFPKITTGIDEELVARDLPLQEQQQREEEEEQVRAARFAPFPEVLPREQLLEAPEEQPLPRFQPVPELLPRVETLPEVRRFPPPPPAPPRVRVPETPPPRVPRRRPPRDPGEPGEMREVRRPGRPRAEGVAWQQGEIWISIYPPFNQDEIHYTRSPLPNTRRVRNPRQAFRLIEQRTGSVPAETYDEWAEWFGSGPSDVSTF